MNRYAGTFEERLGAALAARPTDPGGLAELAGALSDRLAQTGGPAEIAAAAWLADRARHASR
jgi:hypothetical protein